MTGDFLKQALTTILAERQHPQLQIVDLCLETLHAAVECSDGSAGLALNYDQEGNEQLDPQLLRTLGQRLLERATSQPLLAETLFLPDEAPTLRALSIALLNALSAPLCQPEEAMRRGFVALPGRLPLQSFYGLATRLTVVGCGGYLEEALHLPWLQRVACLDLHFDTSEGRARYQPYLENVVEPHRQHKEIVLEGPSSSPTILAETDLLCLSGSTLCNDTFWSLAESSRHCCALLLEGHSAGLWPGLLQSWGVQHVVRTPIDLPVAALLRRYAGQLQRGHAQLGPGPYVDCLFPERTTLVAISGPARARGQRWLLLQARLQGRLQRLHGGPARFEGLYSDFRHHDLGEAFYEVQYDGSRNRSFRTSPLWGVGSTAPYGHDGASLSLEEVIVRHGGEALVSRQRFEQLAPEQQDELVHFLRGLTLYSSETLPCDVNGDGHISQHFEVAGQDTGTECFNPEWLFATPGRIEGMVSDGEGGRMLSKALTNLRQAYRLDLPALRDRDHDGFADILELQRYLSARRKP